MPAPDEMRAIIAGVATLKDAHRWRPLLLTLIFTGLRSCEVRGLRWSDIDLKRSELQVRQRADALNKIGPPKSEAGERTVPLPPMVVHALREWELRLPEGKLDLVFPRSPRMRTNPVCHRRAGLDPAQVTAGIADEGGAKYKGLHRYAISMPPGASTGASTAGSSCRSSSCRHGSATLRFR